MATRDEPLDALTRLLAEDGPEWLEYFAPIPSAPVPRRRSTFRGGESEPGASMVDTSVAIFHDAERGAGEHRQVRLRLADTPLERGRDEVVLEFDWPNGASLGGVRARARCRLLVDGDVLDIDADHAACAWSEDGVCRLELRLGQEWVERDRRPDALVAGLQGVLIILERGPTDGQAASGP